MFTLSVPIPRLNCSGTAAKEVAQVNIAAMWFHRVCSVHSTQWTRVEIIVVRMGM